MLHRTVLDEKLARLKAALSDRVPSLPSPYPSVVLFFSISDGSQRAEVVTATGVTVDEAWTSGVDTLKRRMHTKDLEGRWLRIDWVETVEQSSWDELRKRLANTKRNYFRIGIALDENFTHAFTEQELNANAMLYGGNRIAHAVLNERNFLIYAHQRFDDGPLQLVQDNNVFLFTTRGVFSDEGGRVHKLDNSGLDSGRRSIGRLDVTLLHTIIGAASDYLAREVGSDGRFVYGYHPCFDRRIETYNTLRHASTLYAMIEAWEVTWDASLATAIERSLSFLVDRLIREVQLPDGEKAAFLVDTGNEIKLGGSAVAILALTKHASVFATEKHAGLAERLAVGIRYMQKSVDGTFTHVLNYPSLSVKQAFRTVYYEGEASFALMRLYAQTGDPRWLAVVEKAFEHFIRDEYWQYHDHWLGYCVNELTRYRPDERYFRFAVHNIADYLDFVENRITTFPTLLELMMAARETISRIAEDRTFRPLLSDIDLHHFERALEKRAHYLLNGHFWPEFAMFFRKPERIVGSFFIRHHAFRVRIDDVEHYLSGLVAYRRYLGERETFRELVAEQRALPAVDSSTVRSWTRDHVQAATGGHWHKEPKHDWMATGLTTYAPAAQAGNLVAIRKDGESVGVLPRSLAQLPDPSGYITAEPAAIPNDDRPLLEVSNVSAAVLDMGRYARDRMSGRITGVTGSAGKTTVVAMLGHIFSAWGAVETSRHNANLPIGVAWNLASINWDTPNVVLEMAIGRMGISARMARPHVAVFTNILPAHLRETKTLADIAQTKSAIFTGMAPGDVAVLNRDMNEREIVENAAAERSLKIVWYGTDEQCDFQLIDYGIDEGRVYARIAGRNISYKIGATGRHMALNSLATLAVVSAYGRPLLPALAKLESFAALPGRGADLELQLGERRITVIDDAYNANPGSMKAALERLSAQNSRGRRIAALGEMAELGPGAPGFHTALADEITGSRIDRVCVVGDLYKDFWERLEGEQKSIHADSLEHLRDHLLSELRDGDTLLIKASNSAKLHKLASLLRE